jgi:hypothetical protein
MRILAVLALAALAVGCATVTRGTKGELQLDSEPPGAEVRSIVKPVCDGPCPTTDPEATQYRDVPAQEAKAGPQEGPACVTPCQVRLPRNQELIVTFTKPGYEPVTVEVKTRMATEGAVGFAGNALVGGIAGGVVDAASGATLEHYPNPVKVTLRPLAAARQEPARARRR